MAGAQGILSNPLLAALSPDDQQTFAQLQQRSAVGQALLQQGLQPMDQGSQTVGGMAYHVSPLNGVAKLLNTYIGNKISMDAAGQQAQLSGRALSGLFGQDQQVPVAQSAPPVAAAGDSGALSGPTAGMGGMQGTPDAQTLGKVLQQNGVATPTQTVTTPGVFSLPGQTAAASRQMYVGLGPEEYGKLRASYATPTDTMKSLLAAGVQPGSSQWNQALSSVAFKDGYVPPVQIGANTTVMQPQTGAMSTTPAAAPAGYQNIQGTDGKWYAVAVGGGPQAVQGSAAADAAGKAGYQLTEVWDPNANNGQGGYVHQTVANAAGATGGDMSTGTPGRPPIPSGAPSGAGVPPLPPGSPTPNSPATATGGGPMAAQPPMGSLANANAQAQGQVQTMQDSYKEARQARATGQNALTMLNDMSSYAGTKSPALANKLYNVQGIFSCDAQLFEKARDNLISQVSSATGMNTDAARSIVEGAIPSYGMNPQALQTGLGQIKSQVQMRMLKGDYLSDAYANGNAPTYNQRENQFDQMMTPTAAAIIKMPPGPARNQAITGAKSSPQDAQALRWGIQTGLLR